MDHLLFIKDNSKKDLVTKDFSGEEHSSAHIHVYLFENYYLLCVDDRFCMFLLHSEMLALVKTSNRSLFPVTFSFGWWLRYLNLILTSRPRLKVIT